jgi:hypothetical protein
MIYRRFQETSGHGGGKCNIKARDPGSYEVESAWKMTRHL